MELSIRVGQIVPVTEAEGPGHRFAVWVQGCSIRCPGCCNPEMFTTDGGATHGVGELSARILATPGIEGVSFLGGEPFEQAAPLAEIARAVRGAGLSAMTFTGYTLDELRARKDAGADALLAKTDLLVDGRFDRHRLDHDRRWVGSTNQRLHFLTDRYSPHDPRFSLPNTAEVHVVAGAIVVNGWPELAQRIRRALPIAGGTAR